MIIMIEPKLFYKDDQFPRATTNERTADEINLSSRWDDKVEHVYHGATWGPKIPLKKCGYVFWWD